MYLKVASCPSPFYALKLIEWLKLSAQVSHALFMLTDKKKKLEGQIQGKKAYGRPRTMLLDGLLKTEEGNISYEEPKMLVQDRSRWSQ